MHSGVHFRHRWNVEDKKDHKQIQHIWKRLSEDSGKKQFTRLCYPHIIISLIISSDDMFIMLHQLIDINTNQVCYLN